jgi:hypothetical protein
MQILQHRMGTTTGRRGSATCGGPWNGSRKSEKLIPAQPSASRMVMGEREAKGWHPEGSSPPAAQAAAAAGGAHQNCTQNVGFLMGC